MDEVNVPEVCPYCGGFLSPPTFGHKHFCLRCGYEYNEETNEGHLDGGE